MFLGADIATDSESLVLHVGSETFAFEDADTKEVRNRKWNGSGLSWTTGEAVELKLTETTTNAMGQPEISGAPQDGKELTAEKGSIDDTDGLPSGTFPSGYTFVWVSVDTSNVEAIVDVEDRSGTQPYGRDDRSAEAQGYAEQPWAFPAGTRLGVWSMA